MRRIYKEKRTLIQGIEEGRKFRIKSAQMEELKTEKSITEKYYSRIFIHSKLFCYSALCVTKLI